MKKYILVFTAICLVLIGCNALNKLTQFKIPYSSNFSMPKVPALPSGAPDTTVSFPSPSVNTNITQYLKDNSTDADLVQSVKLDEMNLIIESPSGADFSFLKSVRVFIMGEGLSEVEVAHKNNIQASPASPVKLDLTGNEIKEHILKDNISFRVEAVAGDSTATPIDAKIDLKVFVDAKILGI